MRKIWCLFLITIFCVSISFGQAVDTTKVKQDSTTSADTTKFSKASILLKKQIPLLIPTMPQLPRMRENKKSIHFDVSSHYKGSRPEEATNWDAANRPPGRYDYPHQKQYQAMFVPVTPLADPQKDLSKPLSFSKYLLPSRAEIDILEILWAKEDVQDTTIYSCLDTMMNVTMSDLNLILEGMAKKGFVSRKIVSPRNEFNAFGVLIEMSPNNRRNRIYEYHSLVNRNLMRAFIDANYFLFKEDSSIVNRKQLEAARKDSTLLKDLNTKIQKVKKN